MKFQEILDVYPQEDGVGFIASFVSKNQSDECVFEYAYVSTDFYLQNHSIQPIEIIEPDEYYVCSCLCDTELWYIKGRISTGAVDDYEAALQTGVNSLFLCNQSGEVAEITTVVSEIAPDNSGVGLETDGCDLYLYGVNGGIAKLNRNGNVLWTETPKNDLLRLIPTESAELLLLTVGGHGALELASFKDTLSSDVAYEVLNGISVSSAVASCYTGQQFLIFSDNTLYQVDPGRHEVLELLDGYEAGMNLELNPYLAMLCSGDILLCTIEDVEEDGMYYESFSFYLLNRGTGEISDVRTIVLGSLQPGSDLKEAIAAYNESTSGVIVQLADYSEYDEDAMQQMQLDITSGTGPDIIDFANCRPDTYMKSGYLLDLEPFLAKREDVDTWVDGILDAVNQGNSSYCIAPYYELSTILTTDSEIQHSFSLPEFIGFVNESPDYYEMFSTQSFLQTSLAENMTLFVDKEAGKCDFTQSLFVDLLTTAIKCTGAEALSEPAAMFRGESRICEVTMPNAKSAIACCRLGKASVIGYPSSQGGTIVVPVSNLAVNVQGQTEDALAFISYVLELETQQKAIYSFPLSKIALDKRVDELEHLYSDMPETAKDSKALIEQTVEQIGAVYQADTILAIITDEAIQASAGIQTPEEAAEIIQKRVQIYLSEHI